MTTFKCSNCMDISRNKTIYEEAFSENREIRCVWCNGIVQEFTRRDEKAFNKANKKKGEGCLLPLLQMVFGTIATIGFFGVLVFWIVNLIQLIFHTHWPVFQVPKFRFIPIPWRK